MPDKLVMCRCGNKAKYYADNKPVCGVCLNAGLMVEFKRQLKSGGAVAVSIKTAVQEIIIKGCPTDRTCAYWSSGKCIVHSCVKGD